MEKIVKFKALLYLFIFILLFCLALFIPVARPVFASSYNKGGHSENLKEEYRSVLEHLDYYKSELNLLSKKISEASLGIDDLKEKIGESKSKSVVLKKEIKQDNLYFRNLLGKIFIFQRERETLKLLSIKDDYNDFIVNYELKSVLEKEESNLKLLMERSDTLLSLQKLMDNEREGVSNDLASMNNSKETLKILIRRANFYILRIKKKLAAQQAVNNKRNKELNKLVIKLLLDLKKKMHNLPGSGNK